GSHNVRSIAHAQALAEQLGIDRSRFEFQFLYGMAGPIKRALVEMRYRVREYCPVGELLPGMSYLVRRLLENTSNEGFLRAKFSEHVSAKELLRDPGEIIRRAQSASPFGRERRILATTAEDRHRYDGANGGVQMPGAPPGVEQPPGAVYKNAPPPFSTAGAMSSPPLKSLKSANHGPKRTATSARRSISATFTRTRCA